MRIVNEAYKTRRITLRKREGDDPTGEVVEEHVVEFDDRGRAEVDQDLGEFLVESDRYPPIREAEGPDDVSSRWEADQRGDLSGVDFASERAEELARDEFELDAEDFDGETPSGDTGFTADDVRAIAGE